MFVFLTKNENYSIKNIMSGNLLVIYRMLAYAGTIKVAFNNKFPLLKNAN